MTAHVDMQSLINYQDRERLDDMTGELGYFMLFTNDVDNGGVQVITSGQADYAVAIAEAKNATAWGDGTYALVISNNIKRLPATVFAGSVVR
jgi:hypothetical protein